ncbi:MAG: DNA translocase FtsK [Eikenella sp.]|nr:DNA translocase FtsK [Eikenella sp.]
MFLILILILLLAGIAFLLWWRGKEEREWLMELAYLSRHEGRATPAANGSDTPKQQPARPNVQDQRSQQQVKRHYQKIQDDLRRKIEQLGPAPNKKKPRRRKADNQEELPIFQNEAADTPAAVVPPAGQSAPARPLPADWQAPAADTADDKPSGANTPAAAAEPDLSHPAPELSVISLEEATRRLWQAEPAVEETDAAPAEPEEISLDEATRLLAKTAPEPEPVRETVVLNLPPKHEPAPAHDLEEITPDDPALRYVREKMQRGWAQSNRTTVVSPRLPPRQPGGFQPAPAEPEAPPAPPAEPPRTISHDDIRSNLLRQRLASRRAQQQAAQAAAEAAQPMPDLAVIGEDEVLANLAKTDSPANRERSRFKRLTVRESVIPAAARLGQSYSLKVPAEQPVSAPISTRFTPFEQRPDTYGHLPPESPAAAETETPAFTDAPQPADAQVHISDNPPWTITDRLLSESPAAPEEQVHAPSGGLPFRPDLSLGELAPAAEPLIELGDGKEWQQALAEGVPQPDWAAADETAPAAAWPVSAPAAAYTPKTSFTDFAEYALPVNDLLLPPQYSSEAAMTEEQLIENGITIEEKLAEFRVKVKVVDAYAGPVITRYEIEPDVGVRGNSVINLEKDLARSLGVAAIRVVETIPGKTCMGLELPNPKRQMIRLSEVFDSPAFQNSSSKLTLALGQDITGQPVVTDLAKAPHLLVAGTTGSGKSVGVNSMILSMLFKATPDEVRLIMIDPKMLELSIYEGIPHLLAPVVTDMKLAANALTWCVNEMEKRYRLMSHVGVRNLAGYNQKIKEAAEQGDTIANPFSLTPDQPEPLEKLPFIVVVVDEFADLMMTAGKKIEELIARLAQKARAAGIHLILATQRPSVDVITGLIKANIPTRIAFQVSSKVDSRTILDQMGAENLLGQGDMLFLPPGTGYPQRVHGAFVADEEVHGVVEYLKGFGEPDYVEDILTAGVGGDDLFSNAHGGYGGGDKDPLFDEAVAIVLRTQKATISSIQRHLRIGYNKAATLVDQMEAEGIVSAADTNGKRTILARQDQLDGDV